MQMLNFVKISTMLLLLQLISTNTQHNNPYTEKYYHEYGLRVYSELKYIYPEIVEVDINNFIKEMRKRIENKADNLQME
ncbi:Egg protein [Schistosoma japonicum]|nr:Egg protein [Schistosoma japonicum]